MAPNPLALVFSKSKTSGTRMVVFSFVAMFALILSACGGSQNPANQTTPAGKKHVLTVLANPGKAFTPNFNPFNSTNDTTWGTQGLIYESLVYVNQKDGTATPWLASVPDVSADGLSMTFHITPNVKWSDGQPFTSDDVLFTFQSMQQNPTTLDKVNSLFKTMIASVSAPDASTFVVTLQKPNATALYYIGDQTWIVPKHIWSTISDPGKTANEKPVGTGPFTLSSFSPQIYKMTKNPTFWNTSLAPKVDEINVPAETDNTNALLALSQGKADWAGIGYDPKNDATWVNKDPAHNHTYFPPSNIVMMKMNLTKFPFNNLAVRQAINIAIDRSELQAKAAPYAKPANPTGLILPAHSSYLASAYQDLTYTPDDAKAESILKAAGFVKDANGIYALNGKEISFKLATPTGWTDWNDDTKLIAQQLSKIGIKVETEFPDFVNVYQPALANGNYDAVLHWTDPGPTPFYLFKDLLASSQIPSTNVQRWKDDATDKLLAQYVSTTDTTAQTAAIQGLEKIMVEQVPAISLTYNPFWDEYSTARFTGWPDANNATYNPSPYSYPDMAQIILHLTPVS